MAQPAAAAPASAVKRLSTLDRLLPLWIFLAMGLGLGLGYAYPGVAKLLDAARIDTVSLPIAVGLLLGEKARGERVRLRALALVGNLVFLRIAHGAVVRQLGWRRAGPRQLAAVDELVRESVGALAPRRKTA